MLNYYKFAIILDTAALALVFLVSSCIESKKTSTAQQNHFVVERITHFGSNGPMGIKNHSDTLALLYADSIVIEKIKGINIYETKDTFIISSIPFLFRFIDLRRKQIVDYNFFSDTSVAVDYRRLTDSIFNHGWNFYSRTLLPIQQEIYNLPDTLIEGQKFKRLKFSFQWNEPEKEFSIGYFDYSNSTKIFSLDPKLSDSIGLNMIKRIDYVKGRKEPIAITELKLTRHNLTDDETAVINSWKKKSSSQIRREL